MNRQPRNIRFWRYELPRRRIIKVGRGLMESRCGLIVQLIDESGTVGLGEIAPLPGLHGESLDDCIRQLADLPTATRDALNDPSAVSHRRDPAWDDDSLYPSVRNGLGMACAEAGAKLDSMLSNREMVVPVAGLVTARHDPLQEAVGLLQSGFTTLKVKVGRKDPSEERELIDQLLELEAPAVPGIENRSFRLRLDGNRAWSLDDALRFFDGLNGDRIEYLEEPLRCPQDHDVFVQKTGLRIALDETLVDLNPNSDPPIGRATALVLKPAVLGGFGVVMDWIRYARQNGIVASLSSCYESGVAARFYAALACDQLAGSAQGLDTLKFLAADTVRPTMVVERGMLRVHRHVALNLDVLREVFCW
ncbi:MAG: o-succinylbenzoate synthase [Phycisphaeraceae bacterium]|nr:o-succinylbenzoate synthase [Phycisphaeraceae bacterium]